MNKPYLICYMMMSVDGRIDCAMTSQLDGDSYYELLSELNVPTTISGRNTAELEMALPGEFLANDKTPFGKTGFSKAGNAQNYDVVVDSRGRLLWPVSSKMDKPLLIITGENVSKEYLHYLDEKGISWIAAGKEKTDLPLAMKILKDEFGIERAGIVGGPAINTAFLDAGLLDEIIVLIGNGIDGRASMPSVFDGREDDHPLTMLNFVEAKTFDDGSVMIRYTLR